MTAAVVKKELSSPGVPQHGSSNSSGELVGQRSKSPAAGTEQAGSTTRKMAAMRMTSQELPAALMNFSGDAASSGSQEVDEFGLNGTDALPGTTGSTWTAEEQEQLDRLMIQYPAEQYSATERYIHIAAGLTNKTARDVALRLRWLSGPLPVETSPTPPPAPPAVSAAAVVASPQQEAARKRKPAGENNDFGSKKAGGNSKPTKPPVPPPNSLLGTSGSRPGSCGDLNSLAAAPVAPAGGAAKDALARSKSSTLPAHAVPSAPPAAPALLKGIDADNHVQEVGAQQQQQQPLPVPALPMMGSDAFNPAAGMTAAAAAAGAGGLGPNSFPMLSNSPFSNSQQQLPPPLHVPPPGSLPADAAAALVAQLLDQNCNILGVFKVHMAQCKVVENMELLARYRDNIMAALQHMACMPGIMQQMPPLPVQPNLEAAAKLLGPVKPVGAHSSGMMMMPPPASLMQGMLQHMAMGPPGMMMMPPGMMVAGPNGLGGMMGAGAEGIMGGGGGGVAGSNGNAGAGGGSAQQQMGPMGFIGSSGIGSGPMSGPMAAGGMMPGGFGFVGPNPHMPWMPGAPYMMVPPGMQQQPHMGGPMGMGRF